MSIRLKVPPPIVALATGLLMWLIARLTHNLAMAIPFSRVLAALIFGLGLPISIAGVRSFRKARTTINPMKPDSASSLVDSGIYRFTRNPMYLGLLLALISLSVLLQN